MPCAAEDSPPPCALDTDKPPSKRTSFAFEPKQPSKEKNMDDACVTEVDKPRASFELSADEEVWIVQCPKSLDLRKLVGARVRLANKASKTSVKSDDLSVDADTHQYSATRLLSVAAASGKIRKMDAVGSIKLKKRSTSTPSISKR